MYLLIGRIHPPDHTANDHREETPLAVFTTLEAARKYTAAMREGKEHGGSVYMGHKNVFKSFYLLSIGVDPVVPEPVTAGDL